MDQPPPDRSDATATHESPPAVTRGVGRNVVALGWVSFFTDLASEMLYPIIPLFLVGTLGATPALLGIIDGLAEGIGSGLRWLGGALSDRFRRRKPFVLAGYAISAISKPVMGLAQAWVGWPLLLVGRCSDRLGKSLRTAARGHITRSPPAGRRAKASATLTLMSSGACRCRDCFTSRCCPGWRACCW